MIIDTTLTKIERQITDRQNWVSFWNDSLSTPEESGATFLIARRFRRDCIHCLQRTIHPEPCKYRFAAGESDNE